MATSQQLWEAARAVITSLHALPDSSQLQQAKIVIIGGLALQHHAPGYWTTKDVDILIFDPERPICALDVEAKLTSRFPYEFEYVPEPVSYCLNIPNTTKVDFIPQELPPYLPADAPTLQEVDPNHLPFLPLLDLLVYKIYSCGMRPIDDKRDQDADDAQELVDILSQQGTITLDDSQKQAVLSGLDELLKDSERDRDWWESALGLSS